MGLACSRSSAILQRSFSSGSMATRVFFRAYDAVEFLAPVHAGDFIEARGAINRHRQDLAPDGVRGSQGGGQRADARFRAVGGGRLSGAHRGLPSAGNLRRAQVAAATASPRRPPPSGPFDHLHPFRAPPFAGRHRHAGPRADRGADRRAASPALHRDAPPGDSPRSHPDRRHRRRGGQPFGHPVSPPHPKGDRRRGGPMPRSWGRGGASACPKRGRIAESG